jgi:hypothetical protein
MVSLNEIMHKAAPDVPSQSMFSALYMAIQPAYIVDSIMTLYCPDTNGCLNSICDLLVNDSIISSQWLEQLLSDLKNSSNSLDEQSEFGGALLRQSSHAERLNVLRNLLLRLNCNSFEGISDSAASFGSAARFSISATPESVAAEIFINISRLNHSCRPNAFASHVVELNSVSLQVRACADIKSGEEVCISYLSSSDAVMLTHEQRVQRLMLEKQFICRCVACRTGDHLRTFKCPKCNHESMVVFPDVLLVCLRSQCKHLASLSQKTQLMTAEKSLAARVSIVERLALSPADADSNTVHALMSETCNRVQQLLTLAQQSSLASSHYLVRSCWTLLRDVYETKNCWSQAAYASERVSDADLMILLGARRWNDANLSVEQFDTKPFAVVDAESCYSTSMVSLFASKLEMVQFVPISFEFAVELERAADSWMRIMNNSADIRHRVDTLLRVALFAQQVLHGTEHEFCAHLHSKLAQLATSSM